MFHSNSQSNLNNKSNSPLNERNKEIKYIKKNKITNYFNNNNILEFQNNNFRTPYKEKTENISYFKDINTERNTMPFQISEQKISIPEKYNINTHTYINKNNIPDLNLSLNTLNLTLDPSFNIEYNPQNELLNKNIPYKKAKINKNFNVKQLSFPEGNTIINNNQMVKYASNDINLNNINSFDNYSKSQSPAYRKKNVISYHNYKIINGINESKDLNLRKSTFSLFKEREDENFQINVKKIQKVFRGFLTRKKFFERIRISNDINIANCLLKDYLKKNIFETLKNCLKGKNQIENNNDKPIYKKKPSINKKNEVFSVKKKNNSSEGIILIDKNSDENNNLEKKLREYESQLNILKKENERLRNINNLRYDNVKESNIENQLKEQNRNLSIDIENNKNDNNKSLNLKVFKFDDNNLNNESIINSSFRNSSLINNTTKLKIVLLKQFFWKKEAIYQKLLFIYMERWFSMIEKEKIKKELIEKREKILLKYITNKDNYLFLITKEKFRQLLFNGIMKENLYLRKEQKKEILEKIVKEEKENIKKSKLLKYLVLNKHSLVNNILQQYFKKFYFNGLYNQIKREKNIDIRKSMTIDPGFIKKNKKKKNNLDEDSFFVDESIEEVIKSNNNINKTLTKEQIEINEKKLEKLKKIFLKKNQKNKEFFHKCFIKFYYRGIYKQLIVSRRSMSSSLVSNETIVNSTSYYTVDNSNNINNTNNTNNINNTNNTNKDIHLSKLIEPKIYTSIYLDKVNNNENKEKEIEKIEKEEKKEEIKVEVNEEEIEKKQYTNRLEKARNLRKFLVNKEKEKKDKIRIYFYKFYKAGIIRLMRLEGRKRKASRQSSLNEDSKLFYSINNKNNDNLNENNNSNSTPLITENLLKSIELKKQELKLAKLDNLFYKKNRKIKVILKNIIHTWNLKSGILKLKRANSGLKKKKSNSKNKILPSNESSKNLSFKKKNSSKVKNKKGNVKLIPKSKSQVALIQKNNEDNSVNQFIEIIEKVKYNYYKRIFFDYLENDK